jgi:hypothetical protein
VHQYGISYLIEPIDYSLLDLCLDLQNNTHKINTKLTEKCVDIHTTNTHNAHSFNSLTKEIIVKEETVSVKVSLNQSSIDHLKRLGFGSLQTGVYQALRELDRLKGVDTKLKDAVENALAWRTSAQEMSAAILSVTETAEACHG